MLYNFLLGPDGGDGGHGGHVLLAADPKVIYLYI